MIEVTAGGHSACPSYALAFERVRFALLPSLSLDHLAHFPSQPGRRPKTRVRIDTSSLGEEGGHLAGTHFILLSHYQEILLVPYLLRKLPQLQVVGTNLTIELARIYLSSLQAHVANYDSVTSTLNRDEERLAETMMEIELGAEPSKWLRLFTRSEVEQLMGRVLRVNYYQQLNTERGVVVVAHPSGRSNGACCWELVSQSSPHKVLVVSEVSQHSWRTCQSYSSERIRSSHLDRPFDYVLFTKQALSRLREHGEEQAMVDLMGRVEANMQRGVSTALVFKDELVAVDMIPRLKVQPQGNCRQIVFSQRCFHDYINYCNSFADYLAPHFKDQLFADPPDHPFRHYLRHRHNRAVSMGSIEELAVAQRIPPKEVLLKNSPLLYFATEYERHLTPVDITRIKEAGGEEMWVELPNTFSVKHLESFLHLVEGAKAVGFGEGPGIDHLESGIKHTLGRRSALTTLTATNLGPTSIQSFELKANQLSLSPCQPETLLLPRDWAGRLASEFRRQNITVVEQTVLCVRTPQTVVELGEEGLLRVRSQSVEELLLVGKSMDSGSVMRVNGDI